MQYNINAKYSGVNAFLSIVEEVLLSLIVNEIERNRSWGGLQSMGDKGLTIFCK